MARAPHHRLRLAAVNDREPGGEAEQAQPVIDLAGEAEPPRAPAPMRRDALWIAGAIAAFLVLAGLSYMTLHGSRAEPNSVRVPLPMARPAEPAPALLPDPLASLAPDDALLPSQSAELGAPPPQAVLAAPLDAEPYVEAPLAGEPEPARKPHRSPTVVFDAGAQQPSDTPPDISANEDDGSDARARIEAAVDEIVQRPANRARRAGSATLTRGTLIPAVLETAIDSSVPGSVRAIVSADVRSQDGRRVLVPRSSRLVGRYRTSGQGAGRQAEVVWTRLTRPDGLTVGLGTGADGLQSVLGATGQAGGTIRIRQGEPVRVYAGRDIELGQ